MIMPFSQARSLRSNRRGEDSQSAVPESGQQSRSQLEPDVARTLSSNHMPDTAGQVINLGAFAENFTCLLYRASVTGARARDAPPRNRSPLVSAAPRLWTPDLME